MNRRASHDFDESLLSGLLDGSLTQQESQTVRLHIESCPDCAQTFAELKSLREETMNSNFSAPPDDQWNEKPRGLLSSASFGLGWAILLAWIVGITGFAIGQIWADASSPIERLLTFGALTGFALLFLSVLIDRLQHLGSDRYRRIKK